MNLDKNLITDEVRCIMGMQLISCTASCQFAPVSLAVIALLKPPR